MTAKVKKEIKKILSVLLIFMAVMLAMFYPFTVLAESGNNLSKTYETYREGTCSVEIGILSDNVIKLENEMLVFDFSGISEPLGDDLMAVTKAKYVLTNTSTKEVNTSIAVPEILRLEEVTINREEESLFESGRSIIIDGESENGMIFANTTIDRLRRDSVYENLSEILSHVDYKMLYNEGFSLYSDYFFASASNNSNEVMPENDTVNYYKVSDDGELYLCSVIYNLSFAPGESHVLEITGNVLGEMNRSTKYTDMGTTYSFSYVGDTLSSFYIIGDISITFNLPEKNILPMTLCDAPRYLDDDVWTIRYKGNTGNFTFTLGKELTEEQITDVYTTFGMGKVLINAVEVITATFVFVSGAYIFYSVRKRKASGIGVRK